MAISAMEKQVPKKPEHTILRYKCNGEDIEINHPECPQCREDGLLLWDAGIPVGNKFCKRCGQAIDWTEGEGCV
jgi:ribosomal protein S27AE